WTSPRGTREAGRPGGRRAGAAAGRGRVSGWNRGDPDRRQEASTGAQDSPPVRRCGEGVPQLRGPELPPLAADVSLSLYEGPPESRRTRSGRSRLSAGGDLRWLAAMSEPLSDRSGNGRRSAGQQLGGPDDFVGDM